MKNRERIRFITVTGIIAGLYAAMTLLLAPLSFGPIQCRLSEALTILAVYTPMAIPGLTLGCAISNLVGLSMGANVAGALDVLLGPIATGLAAWLTYCWRRQRIGGLPVLATLPPIILNALIVGTELAVVTVPDLTIGGWLFWAGAVGLGQVVACMGGGLVLAKTIEKTDFERYLTSNDYTD